MMRRPEAKRESSPSCSILSLGRPAHARVDRRVGGYGIFAVSQNVSPWLLIWLRSDTLGNRPVRTRMPGGVGGRGIKTPFLSLLYLFMTLVA